MIKFGVSPIAWSNDDLPSLGGTTSLQSCLSDIQDVGFSGVELGGKFPREAFALTSLLQQYRLSLVGGWYSTNLLEMTAQSEIERMQDHLGLLCELGCEVFIAAETSNAIHGNIDAPMRKQPTISKADWALYCERISEVAEYVSKAGLKFAYHHHLGTIVERTDDLMSFLEATSEDVGLTLDTGHAAGGGIDSVSIIKKYPSRIAHVHCKDIRQPIFNRTLESNDSFLTGVIDGMFTVPGDGDLKFLPVFDALADINYEGWVIVEAEQDPEKASPIEYARVGLETVTTLAQQAGLLSNQFVGMKS